jgi:hypothetical protein
MVWTLGGGPWPVWRLQQRPGPPPSRSPPPRGRCATSYERIRPVQSMTILSILHMCGRSRTYSDPARRRQTEYRTGSAAPPTLHGFSTGPHAPQPPSRTNPGASSRPIHLRSVAAAYIVHSRPPLRHAWRPPSCSDHAERCDASSSERLRRLHLTPRAWLLCRHRTSSAW